MIGTAFFYIKTFAPWCSGIDHSRVLSPEPGAISMITIEGSNVDGWMIQ